MRKKSFFKDWQSYVFVIVPLALMVVSAVLGFCAARNLVPLSFCLYAAVCFTVCSVLAVSGVLIKCFSRSKKNTAVWVCLFLLAAGAVLILALNAVNCVKIQDYLSAVETENRIYNELSATDVGDGEYKEMFKAYLDASKKKLQEGSNFLQRQFFIIVALNVEAIAAELFIKKFGSNNNAEENANSNDDKAAVS